MPTSTSLTTAATRVTLRGVEPPRKMVLWSTSPLCAREVGASGGGGGGVADKTKLYHGELIQLV